MLHDRRIRKQVQPHTLLSNLDAAKKKQLIQKKTAFIKSSYQSIPLPTKLSYPSKVYALYAVNYQILWWF